MERAVELLEIYPAASELLKFYCRIAAFQESIFESLRNAGCTDLKAVARHLPDLCALIMTDRNPTFSSYTSDGSDKGLDEWETMLRRYWEGSR
ncbi:MAG: hypothetical protein ACRD7E_11475, partial [Bryobacteraceae bacterium]